MTTRRQDLVERVHRVGVDALRVQGLDGSYREFSRDEVLSGLEVCKEHELGVVESALVEAEARAAVADRREGGAPVQSDSTGYGRFVRSMR